MATHALAFSPARRGLASRLAARLAGAACGELVAVDTDSLCSTGLSYVPRAKFGGDRIAQSTAW